LGRLLGIGLHGQALDGLQSGGDSLLPGLGMTDVVGEALEEIVDGGIL
jgi:hypothetical protein